MPGLYDYLGPNTLGYADYRDLATGRMLVASPGGSYGMEAISLTAPVPPTDGRWAQASVSSGPPPEPPPVPPVPSVPALAEGSDA